MAIYVCVRGTWTWRWFWIGTWSSGYLTHKQCWNHVYDGSWSLVSIWTHIWCWNCVVWWKLFH